MSGPGPRTTWEDLANLGCWLSRDVLVGQPRIASESADRIKSSTIVWTRDNSQKLEDVAINWTETWTNSMSASLSVSNRGRRLVEPKYFDYGCRRFRILIDISTAVKRLNRIAASSPLHGPLCWFFLATIVQQVSGLERPSISNASAQLGKVKRFTTSRRQDYGLSPSSLMASGKVTSTGWVLLLPKPQTITKLNPTGVQHQLGPQHSERNYGVAWIIRTGRDGRRTVEPLPLPEGKNPIVRMSKECGAKFPPMVPGVEKAGN
ncbi:hypothetical protein B0H13DRAFT_1922808 [Mycena leptocephala]|nr:hypothetical protein B0H13DRAFT_1922808 [Mycena leptocephala]